MLTLYADKLKKVLPKTIFKIGSQIYIDKKWPKHIFLETTSSCNLLCDYCPREKVNNHMDFNLFKSIVDEATHYGPRSFSLHLFGEPLLYPKIWEAIRYIKKKNKHHTVLLTSNGTLFERYADELTSSGIDKLIWSWRPEAKFSEILKERLRKWGKLTVRLLKEVVPKEEMDYWEKWPSVEVKGIHNYGGNISLEKFGAKDTGGNRYPCYHLWLAPAVSWNGNLLICCNDPHQKEVIGNLKNMTVSEGWKKLEGIRKAHLEGKYDGICRDCNVWQRFPDLFFGWQKRA